LPPLPIVDTAQWDAMPSDELVARRVLELDAAQVLEAVRVAIDADDWPRAEQLASAALQRFAQHEWAAAILATMQRLIGARDKRLSAKEAMYASRSLNVRLSSAHEENLGIEAAMSLPRFLRRKPEQGKGES
jgi:Ca-activated chloride channel family protein